MLLLKFHCLLSLEQFTESLQLIDQLIDKMGTDQMFEMKGATAADLQKTRSFIVDKMSDIRTSEAEVQSQIEEKSEKVKGQFWIHPTCQLMHDPRKGRHYVAKQFVPEGTVILVENPIALHLEEPTSYCYNCAQLLNNQFWPCNGCNEVAFCDKECWLESYNSHHKHECGFVGFFDTQKCYCLYLANCFSIAFKIISGIGVRRALELMKDKDDSVLEDFTTSEIKESDFETIFKDFLCLTDNKGRTFGPKRDLIDCCNALEMTFLLEYTNELDFNVEKDLDSYTELADFCLKISRKATFNTFGIKKPDIEKPIGVMVNIVASFFNHSCYPNVGWETKNGQFIGKVFTDIQEGQELTISYGFVVMKNHFVERQSNLRSSYLFVCGCRGCLMDCRVYMTLQCLQCSGPVFVDFEPSEDMTSDRFCLECGTKFDNWETAKETNEKLRQMFYKMLDNLNEDDKRQNSLMIAELCLKKLMKRVCLSSIPFLKCLYRLLKVYNDYGMSDKAVVCGEAVESTIQLQVSEGNTIPSIVVQVLVLMTDLYQKYLKKSQMMDIDHWDRCLRMYSILTTLLEGSQKWSVIEPQPEMSDAEHWKVSNQFAHQLESKRSEMKELSELYKSYLV